MSKIQGILILVSLTIFGIATDSLIESKQYPKWQSVKAELKFIYVHNASSPTVAGASDWGSDIGTAKYTYKVGNQTYTGIKIMPLQNVYLPKEKIANLRKGNITIFYDPTEPSKSFIYATTPLTQLTMLFLIGLAIITIAISLPKLTNYFLTVTREST